MNTKQRTRWRSGFAFLGIAVCAIGIAPRSASAAPVHIDVDTGSETERGAGISVGKGQECFVVAPLHVVLGARKILITDGHGRTAEATPFQAPQGVDAALLKVEAGHTLDCPEDWVDGTEGQDALHEADFLVSRKIQQNGVQQRRFFLSSESSTELVLQPFSSGEVDQLIEGDSGSSLYAKNALVGMVYEVDTATGESRAIKQTYLHALFSGLVLSRAVKRVLVNPVYQQFQENRYATVAVRDFMDEHTSFDIVELAQADAAAALLSLRQGKTPSYPDTVDYVVSTSIIENRSRQEANPNFKAGAADESNFGKQVLNALGNRTARYLNVANIDVEIQVLTPADGRVQRHIEELEYKTALTDNVDRRELGTELTVRAVKEALEAALSKFEIPMLAEEKDDDDNPFSRFFKRKKE